MTACRRITRGCAIRNCYVNGEIIYGTFDPAAHLLDQLRRDRSCGDRDHPGATSPHEARKRRRSRGDGERQPGQPLQRRVRDRERRIRDQPSSTSWSPRPRRTPETAMWAGGVSSIPVAVQSIVPDDTLEVCPTLELHDFQIYEPRYTSPRGKPIAGRETTNLRVLGVLKPGLVYSAAFNGAFPVDDYIPSRPYEVSIPLCCSSRTPRTMESLCSGVCENGACGPLGGTMGPGTVVEGNRVFHCATGGPFHDTWASKDLIARNKLLPRCPLWAVQNLSGISTTPYAIPLVSLDQ